MFRLNNTHQDSIFDRKANMTERELGFLNRSWSADFAKNVFPYIDEMRFAPLYSSKTGRPNTPVNVMVGASIIKEMFDYTDEEMVEHMLFDVQVQHALNLTSEVEIPFSDRTLSRFRESLLAYEAETGRDLMKEEVLALAQHAKGLLGVGDRVRRMDSMMISSRCKRIGRLELVYTCTENLVEEFVGRNGEAMLPEQLVKYTDKSNKNATIYRAKGDEVSTRLESAIADAFAIKALCAAGFEDCAAYQLMSRMLDDQTEGGKPKAGKDIKSNSLQNPSDPEATFRRKAGKGYTGYTANMVESCGDGANIITDFDFQPNTHPDQDFGSDVINKTEDAPEGASDSKVIIGDGAFASEANFDAAEAKGILFVPTCLTGQEPNKTLVDFTIEDDYITRCPCGITPQVATYNPNTGTLSAIFGCASCTGCRMLGSCPAKQKKDGTYKVSFTDTAYNRSIYANKLETKEYKEYSKKRNGIEGVPSVMRRRYRVDSMPVFGIRKGKLLFGLKVAAKNAVEIINWQKKKCKKSVLTGEVCPI